MNNHKSEAQTRQEIIDKRLKKAGWNVNDLQKSQKSIRNWRKNIKG